MRLSLDAPAGWTVETRDGVSLARGASASLQWGPLIWLPEDQRRWIQLVLVADRPAGTQIKLATHATAHTTTGWPVRFVESQALSADGATTWRLHAFYAFFEHAAIAVATGPSEASVAAMREVLRSARPDWTGPVAALCQLWDITLAASRSDASVIAETQARVHDAGADRDALAAVLADLDAAMASPRPAAVHVMRGHVLVALGRPTDALVALQAAIALDPGHADAHHQAGLVLATLGRTRDAIAAWEAAAASDLTHVDGLYNAGIAHSSLGDRAAALAAWQRGLGRAPRDFWLLRKLVQAHYGLGRTADAERTRAQLIEVWNTTADPGVRQARLYVFHHFEVDGVAFEAVERLVAPGGFRLAGARKPELEVEISGFEPEQQLVRRARELLGTKSAS